MTALKLTKIGDSVGAVFPRELLARLHVEAGDTVYLTESPDGARVTPYNPNFADQMEAAERIMKKRRSVLRERFMRPRSLNTGDLSRFVIAS